MPGDENSQSASSASDQTGQGNSASQNVDGEVSPNSGPEGGSATMTEVAREIAVK